MTVFRGTAAIAWRYALAPACIGGAILLRMSPLGAFFYPTEPFILAVLAAAWFGGAGPGVFAALLSSVTVSQLIPLTELPSTEYRLLWGFFDLPRFISLGLTGAAVGWGTNTLRRAQKALRERERELSKVRDELETKVAERTAHLAASEEARRESQERYERVMLASGAGIWDWDLAKDEFYVSPRFLEMAGLPPDTVFSGREDFMRRGPLHPEDREKWKQAVLQLFAGGGSRLSMELRAMVNGETRWRRLEGICFRDASGRVVRWTGSTVDVSERKQAEEALRRSEERFALALAASNDGIWDWDIVTDQQFFSGRAQRISGLEPGPTVRPRSEWQALREFHPEDAPRRMAALERHLAGETPVYEGEWRVRPAGKNADGEYRWIQSRGVCVRDANGRPLRMVGSLTDIDGRKRMEAALRQSEERYSLALAASEEGHFDVDLDTGEAFNSERMNEIYGIAPGTHLGYRAQWLAQVRFFGDDANAYHAAIRAAEAKGGPDRYEFEYRILRPSGEMRWIRTRGKVTRDAEGHARRRTGTVADVTEAKLAEQALLQSQERYALAMDAAADGHTDWNLVTGEFYISPRLLRILGYPAGTTFADRADWVRRFPFHPEDRKRWESAIAAHFAGIEAKFKMDLRIVVNAETRWVAFTFIATRDPAGKVVRWTGTIADIDDAKRDLATVLDAIPGMVALLTPASEVDVVNNELMTYVGKPLEEIKQWGTNGIVFPEDVPRTAAALMEAMSTGQPYEMEVRIRRFDGTYRWNQTRGLPFRDASGGIVRWYAMVADIDERKRAEEGLRESEERYALAVAGSDDGVWDVDFAAGRAFISARARELAGLPPGPEMVSMDEWFASLPLHPDDVARRHAAVQAHLSGRTPAYEGEFRFRHPDGVYRWRRLHGLCQRDARGKPHRMAGSISDVDVRRRAEEALRLSEERYALALGAADEGHFDNDLETDKMFVSARLNEIYGLAPVASVADRREFLERLPIHPEDRHLVADLAKSDWPAQDVYEVEYRIIPRPGEVRWIHSRAKVTRDAYGRARRRIGVVADITERKRAEEALKLSEERYAVAMQASGEGHWDWKIETDEFYASPRYLELAGFPADTKCGRREDIVPFLPFHPDDRAGYEAAVAAHFAGETPRVDLVIRMLPRGELRWLHVIGSCIRDAAGRPVRWAGSVNDITPRMLAEEALRRSEALLLEGQRLAQMGNFSWLVREGEISWSEQIYRIFEFEPGSPVTLERIATRVPADELAMLRDMVARALRREGDFEYEHRVLLPDGRVKHVHLIGHRVGGDADRLEYIGTVQDITARKLGEQALRASEQRYSLAMEASEEGYVDSNIDTDEFLTSERLNQIFGIPRGTRFADRSDFLRQIRFYGDDAETYRSEIRAVTAQGGPDRYQFEFRIVLPSGAVRWLWTRGVVARDAEGRAHRRIGVVADITARKLAEEGLRASEERYGLAMEASEEGHFDTDLDTDRMFVSARLNEIYGFPRRPEIADRDEYLNRIPFHPDDLHYVAEVIKPDGDDPASGAYDFECRIIPRAGEVRWIHTRGMVMRDPMGRASRRVGVVADITDRKRAEEALRLSEERYALAMEAAEEGHFDWNVRTDEMFASASMRKLLGLPADAEYRTRDDMRAQVHHYPGELERIDEATRRVLASDAEQDEFEYRIMRGAEVRWVHRRWKITRDPAGTAVRVIGVMTDITERKRAADELRESEARFRGLTELWSDWYWRQDAELRFTYSSADTAWPDGKARGSTMGMRRWEIPGIVPISSSWAEHRDLLAARKPFRDFEYSRPSADGTLRYVSSSGTPIFDENGEFRGYQGVARDITERKRFEEERRQSEARFRALTELSSDWYWQQDEKLRFTYTSRQAGETASYPSDWVTGKTRWEMPGITPLSFSWGEHQAALAARQPFRDLEYARAGLDGLHYVSISGAPIFDERGAFRGYHGIGRDITERKRFEEELRSRKEMLEVAQKAARAVPWEWRNGAAPEVNKWSPEMCAMFGLQPGAFDGTAAGWWKLCHAEDRPRVKASIAHALATGEIDVEYRVCHPDGKVRWLNQRGRAFFDAEGKPVRSIGFMFDVTERRRVEDDLRSRQEMLDLAQKAAQAIAFEFKLGAGEGENRWSSDLEAMYGVSPGSYDGSFEAWKKMVHPEDWPAVKEAIRQAHRTGEVASEYRVAHADGSVHWLQAKGRMFFDAAGNATRMVGFMQDITQRKQTEEELRRMEQKLRGAQRLEAMGTLAGGIAHDFNNILGAILGYGEMALRDAKKGTRMRRDMDAIMAAGERGRALVDRILAFSRSGVGERVPVHVEEVVREALDQLAAKLPESVTIAPRLRAGRAAMLGDSTQVHQVVMNLANNAVQAMPQGGVLRVSLETLRMAPRPALIGTISAGEHIVLKVTDAGTGIRPEVLERMFDPFFTTKEVGVGTGLGLSLVHGIVANVGGAIDVATELGRGTTFTVYLPQSGEAPVRESDENRPLPRGEGERVLVVDDEEPLVRLATETLESLGYAPVGFTSSFQALQEFGANPGRFDAILTDERMPVITGSAIIREVRRINPSIPILLMSGFVGAAAALKARELGANDVLRKPLLARELATSLAKVLHP